jgi:heterodisulfide reductase subunit C2
MNTGNVVHGATRHAELFLDIQKMLSACMQCGTCTGSCGSAASMDLFPRELWRMVQFGLKDEIFQSRSFWLCSTCYYCTLRCPRGLPLTEAMGNLKHLAMLEGVLTDKKSPVFYRSFMNNVRRHGRLRETELMGQYFLSLKSPITPFAFLPLGIRLMTRRKVSLHFPGFTGRGKLDAIFRKAEELEASEEA